VPIYGKLSDLLGWRTIVIWGISVFLLGSVLCGFAGSMYQLIIFRFIQGIGAAGTISTAFAIPADLYPPAERARVNGLMGGVFGITSEIGPLLNHSPCLYARVRGLPW
jgi:MFS family permease